MTTTTDDRTYGGRLYDTTNHPAVIEAARMRQELKKEEEALAAKLSTVGIAPATTTVMSYEEFGTSLAGKVGSLMFPDELYDCSYFCDKTKIKKLIKDQLPEKARIHAVLVHTTASPLFKPVANKGIPYKMEVATFANSDGAFRDKYGGWASKMPLGDAIVIFKVPVPRKPKTQAQ